MNRSAARLLLFRLDRKSQVSWLHPVSPFLPLPLPDFKETLVSRKRGEKSLLNLVDAMLPALTKGARGHDVKAAERSGSDFFLPEMSPLPNLSLSFFIRGFLPLEDDGEGEGAKRGEKPDRPSSAAVGGKIGGRDGGEDEWRGVMQSVHFLIWGGKRMEEEEEATPTTAQSRR